MWLRPQPGFPASSPTLLPLPRLLARAGAEARKPLALKGGHPVSGKQGRGGEGLWAGGSRPPTPTPAYFVLALAEGSAWASGTSGTGFSGSVTGKKGNRKDAWGEDEKGCRPPPPTSRWDGGRGGPFGGRKWAPQAAPVLSLERLSGRGSVLEPQGRAGPQPRCPAVPGALRGSEALLLQHPTWTCGARNECPEKDRLQCAN